MNQIYVREAYSEVLIFIDKNTGSRLNALKEAVGILQKEVQREQLNTDNSTTGTAYGDSIQKRSQSDGQ